MAPTWVMLQRSVNFGIVDGNDEAMAAAPEKQNGAAAAAVADPSVEVLDLLGSLKPDTSRLHAPPRISTFGLHGHTKPCVSRLAYGTSIACADESLFVLYGGRYEGPGSSRRGCYLVYDAAAADASTSPLATVPPVPFRIDLNVLGEGAVVTRRHPPRAGAAAAASYLLAELATTIHRDLPHAELYLWWSDARTPEWTKKEVRLPREVAWEPGKHLFSVDTTFSLGTSGGGLCWVDLLQGIVICDDPDRRPADPHFRFVPLPDWCPAVGTSTGRLRGIRPRPRMHEFRSARCIGGVVKLVAVEGLLEGWASDQFRLAIWTLSPDLAAWERGPMFGIQDVWARDRYRDLKLPRQTPSCPVLCENDVVYAIINDAEIVEKEIDRGPPGHITTQLNVKGQYVLELDMQRNDIMSIGRVPPEDVGHLMPNLFAADFTAYLQG